MDHFYSLGSPAIHLLKTSLNKNLNVSLDLHNLSIN